MTCGEFEEALNQSIDAGIWPGAGADSPSDELSRHVADCDRCQRTVRAFGVLRRAIAASAAPRPPLLMADRIERAARLSERRPRFRPAVAAAVLLAAGLGALWLGRAKWNGRPEGIQTAAPARLRAEGTLGDALAQAAAATWDLARETSDPAARLGGPLFATAPSEAGNLKNAGTEVGGLIPTLSAFAPEASAATGALSQVGDRLVEGVRPLSESARKAFERLLGPPRNPPPAQGARASTKGV